MSPPKYTGKGGKRNCQSSEAKLPQRDSNPGPPGRQTNDLTLSATAPPSASSSVTPITVMSSLAASTNLLVCLHSFLFPGRPILSILLPIHPSYFLRTCPSHLSRAFRVFSSYHSTCAVAVMYSFLILSILVTPYENRNIFNSATSISASCLFISATVSNPHNITGSIATLCSFPFTLAGTRPSQMNPDILLQPFSPVCTLFFTYLPHAQLLRTIEPI